MCASATGAAQVAPGLRSLAAAPRLCEPCIHAGSVDKRPNVSGRDNMFKCPCQTCSCQTSLACLLISPELQCYDCNCCRPGAAVSAPIYSRD